MTSPEPCTTSERRQQHLSRDLTPRGDRGRTGTTLCHWIALDQQAVDTLPAARAGRRIVITSLPRCRHCAAANAREKAAAR